MHQTMGDSHPACGLMDSYKIKNLCGRSCRLIEAGSENIENWWESLRFISQTITNIQAQCWIVT